MANRRRQFPHRKDGRFLNYPGEERVHFMDIVRWCLRTLMQDDYGEAALRRLWVQKESTVAQSYPDPAPRITWIGHSTFLIQIAGLSIITDPIFWSPSAFFPRLTRPGLMPEKMPPIDLIVLSHNHPDHMDIRSLRRIARYSPAVRILVPWGDRATLLRRGFRAVSEHMWWDEEAVVSPRGEQITLTFLPTTHDSRRGLFDANRSLWGSWMINAGPEHIYFGGDSSYGSHYGKIRENFPEINTALLPISPCDERERTRHLSAEEAGEAFLDLGAHRFIPMHWGTYHFGDDYPLTPIQRLQTWWETHRARLGNRCLDLLKIGQTSACNRPVAVPVTEELGVGRV
ncbi:MAG: MBL fold metallo-hydrolase [Candidatus Dependentiae bacterium]|nr:MBL fold metallo-hydrolase [Candidatus Dependentiae bacterium]